ncbi:MAG: NAD+ synthase, partial [Acidobacteriaceae bacterium]|nr:NAD+ synthase [Acidobacteriaceae bacterium]
MRIALAQINNTVGDLEANSAKILEFARRAQEAGAELVAFPELALTGYPPRDLVEKDSFLDRTADALNGIAQESAALDLTLVVGYVGWSPANSAIKAQNAAAVIEGGKVVFCQCKMLLPNYDVFDEARYFQPAQRQSICTI